MGLNISNGGGDFKHYLKYNAKARRYYAKKDGQEEVEVNNPSFVIDFDNIKTGWFYYDSGVAPSIILDQDLSTPAAKPSEKHKRGFTVEIFSNNILGGVGDFGSTSGIVGGVVNSIYEQFEKERGQHAGELPVIQCNGVTPEVGKHGTNYKPNMAIVKWIPRPAEFGGKATSAEAPVQQAPAPVAQSASEF